jgi:glutamyl-tRNA reductase
MNHLVVCGLNYHSAPIAVRERFTIPDSCVKHALEALSRYPHVLESAILSTCNRTEVYAVVSDVQAGLKEIENFYQSVQGISDHEKLRPNFKLLREDVTLHLLRVAAGLDSMVLGEGQIMSQVKDAHRKGLEAKTIGSMLDQLFKLALSCGKRVRSETTMGRRAVSVSSAAIELARKMISIDGDITIIGAGGMAQLCMKHLLRAKNCGRVKVLNRSTARLEALKTSEFKGGERLSVDLQFENRHDAAANSCLTLIATSAPAFLLNFDEFKLAREKSAANGSLKDCLLIDISVPRNIDPRIGELPGVTLKHADHLASVVTKNLEEREALVEEAEVIVFESLDEFHTWQRSRIVVPTIAGLREKIEAIRMEEISKGGNGAERANGCRQKEEAETVSRAIVNQILHHPTIQLKATKDYQVLKQQAEALRTLFNLDPLDEQNSKPTSKRHRPPRGEASFVNN